MNWLGVLEERRKEFVSCWQWAYSST
jgi:hypothetical protein